ncbi:MAG: hypothetical protein ABJA67_15215 [Chthonomonadales bacterium]
MQEPGKVGSISAIMILGKNGVVVGGEAGAASIWRNVTRPPVRLMMHRDHASQFISGPHDGEFVSFSYDSTIKIWSANLLNCLKTIKITDSNQVNETCISSGAISPNGKLIAAGSVNGDVRVWEVTTSKLLYRLPLHKSGVMALAFTSDNKYLLSGAGKLGNAVTQLSSGKLVRRLMGAQRAVRNILPLPDDSVASVGNDHVIRFWKLSTGKLIKSVTIPQGGINIYQSLDHKRLLIPMWSQGYAVYDIKLGGVTIKNARNWNGVTCTDISKDMRFIAIGCIDGILRFYEWQ